MGYLGFRSACTPGQIRGYSPNMYCDKGLRLFRCLSKTFWDAFLLRLVPSGVCSFIGCKSCLILKGFYPRAAGCGRESQACSRARSYVVRQARGLTIRESFQAAPAEQQCSINNYYRARRQVPPRDKPRHSLTSSTRN